MLDFVVENNFELTESQKRVNKILELHTPNPMVMGLDRHQNLSDSFRAKALKKREQKANEKIQSAIHQIKTLHGYQQFYKKFSEAPEGKQSKCLEENIKNLLINQNKLLKILLSEPAFETECGELYNSNLFGEDQSQIVQLVS